MGQARMASGPPDPGADFLNGCHQRVSQQHGPADAKFELRARLAIGPDA
jgi:hypothetical protein